MSSSTQLSACQYLFNREPEELFPKIENHFVNQTLETTIKIIQNLVVSHPEALFIFDPTAFNNQCHLYSLFMVQTIPQEKTKHLVNKTLSDFMLNYSSVSDIVEGYITVIDPRFLYLSFLLSYAFLTDPKLLDQLATKSLKEMGAPAPSKQFSLFLKDPGNKRTHAARQALNRLFAEQMQRQFLLNDEPLYLELANIAKSSLQIPASSGKEVLYTFPKFAGVAYLIDVIFQENIPLLFKVKVMTKEGQASFSFSTQKMETLEPATPVIVFEMVAAGEKLSYELCRDIAKQCPDHSQRNPSSKNRHPPNVDCLCCTPNQVNVEPFQQKFVPALAQTKDMLLSLGADFVRHYQQPFEKFFSDSDQFPQLTALFTKSISSIQTFFLSSKRPLNMTVSHVYTDCAGEAAKESLIFDGSYERHLKERGLI